MGEKEQKREREKRKKKGFRFSLRSTKIRSSIFIGERGKVGPRNEGYAWYQNLGVSSNSKR